MRDGELKITIIIGINVCFNIIIKIIYFWYTISKDNVNMLMKLRTRAYQIFKNIFF